ncbi:MAG: Holliday junction resolvase RuvX [Chloroflexota bacterium]
MTFGGAPSRILGIDLGAKRIGLAVADTGIGIARPLATVNRGASLDDDVTAIGRVCRDQRVAELVVGLPIEAAGQEGGMAAGARTWAAALGERLELPVLMHDERLSSFEAEQRLGRMPRGRSGGPPSRTQRNAYRARIDREAASVILQDALDARSARAARAAIEPPDQPATGTAGTGAQEDR